MNTDFFDIITNKEKIQKELIFYSLFLMVFENFVHHWKDTIRSFFSNGYAIDDETGEDIFFLKSVQRNGKILYIKDKDREKEFNNKIFHLVKTRNNYNPKL